MAYQRDMFWDVVKGFAILLVVLGHSINYASGAEYLKSEEFYNNILFIFIYSFHMPIFMVVSGYLFFNSASRHTPSSIIVSRLRMLVIPILTFAVIYKFPMILSVFKGETSLLSFSHDFFTFTFFGYHLWFLWSIFLNTLLVLVVEKFKIPRYTYFFIWICLLLIPGNILNGLYSFMFPFFIIGFLLHQYDHKTQWSNNKCVMIISAFIFLILLFLFDRDTYVYVYGQDIVRENGLYYLLKDIQRFITGLSGSIFIINALRYLHNHFKASPLFNYLSILGKNSMGIYCFHHIFFWQYILRCTRRIHLASWSPGLTILAFIGALAFSLIATYISKKYKITRILFLGGR